MTLYIINACGQQKLGKELLNKENKHISHMTLYFENHMMFKLGRNISLLII